MIETMLENCPSGPILTTDWEYTPHKYAIGATEAPRGEDVHWAMLGNNQKCYRWRAKAATYSKLAGPALHVPRPTPWATRR